jgi:hypothetical protein
MDDDGGRGAFRMINIDFSTPTLATDPPKRHIHEKKESPFIMTNGADDHYQRHIKHHHKQQ